ncbi:MAG: MarR family winged helix-turn-helix transcriptional regulator [Acidaminococcaceae bacterium]
MSRIREKANKLIVRELQQRGVEGIVPSHGEIMVHLFTAEECAMQNLAKQINRTKPTVTVLVEKLVACGYVVKEKSPEDNRITFIKLTAKGWELKPIFAAVSEKMNAVVYQGLGDEESEMLEKVLAKISCNLDQI